MTHNKKADVRNIWVFAVVGALVLVVILSGVWKRFDFFITIASFLGFDSGAPPAGTSIIGVNMEKGDLRYFTGEKWVKIDENAKAYLLDIYEFNPAEIKKSIKSFYRDTKRKPETFSISVNNWRYWNIRFSTDGYGKATISTETKKGFAGPLSTEKADLGYADVLDFKGYSYASRVGSYFPFFLDFEAEKNSDLLSKVVVWRDSILQGNSCEKFLELNVKLKDVQLAPPQNKPKYTVRKIDQYIFIDLNEPVFIGTVEKYLNSDCFKVDSYKDFDRSSWKNDATVQINFIENDAFLGAGTPSKILWSPLSHTSFFEWSYQSEKTNDKKVSLIDKSKPALFASGTKRPPSKYHLDYEKDFYKGLIELVATRTKNKLAAFNHAEEAYDIHVFVKSGTQVTEVTLDDILVTNTKPIVDTPRGLNNDPVVSDKFVYAVLDEYNKYLNPLYYFDIIANDGRQNLLKNGANSGVYMKSGFLYYSVPKNNAGEFDNYIIGSVEDQKFVIGFSGFPSFESLKQQYPLLTSDMYNAIKDALNYIQGKKVTEVNVS
jgi:hypothetical protein